MSARWLSRATPVVATLLVVLAGPAAAQATAGLSICGPVPDEHVQWDYRRATQRQRVEVEGAHFAPQTEALISGKRGTLGGDMQYTLHASPNHHRALIALTRWGERLRSPQAPGMRYSIECYFDRAVRFAPDDQVVRMLYARYLTKQPNRDAEAVAQLQRAIELSPDNPFTHYNVGLIYVDMKRYDEALAHAHRAIALGMDRLELRQSLVAAGKWVEPAAAGAATPAAAASASASASASEAASAAAPAAPASAAP